ncbi:YcdB/YcdC domain-containing protein [Lysinibacillus piscis]|uniref:SLH domain-containing protein n=1 Tax=Lysinibacillus piscis TaxID=2518931 RepID=A0ABQ5NQC4_9BACI|nr:YcdB/YcdC domain-containing protein [Lysinibacillus sp. KH24]GLC90229.1 hypothetical protein LYSBPC_33560 [Lysinibacillus sp. KH24]
MKFKNLGIVLASAALTVGAFTPTLQASANGKDTSERIEIALTDESKVTKSTLIKQLRALFPEKFDFLTDDDFYTGRGHYYTDDKTIRYELGFNKSVDGKEAHGNFTFKGDKLELENFYYRPLAGEEAIYPLKYSEEDAKKATQDFLKKVLKIDNFKLRENKEFWEYNYYGGRLLSEPQTYSFIYDVTQNGVPIADQMIAFSVLANGEVVSMNRNIEPMQKATFDDTSKKKEVTEILPAVQDNMAVELRYMLDYDFKTDERIVRLVYAPAIGFNGVQALTGQWKTPNGFVSQVPKAKTIEKLSKESLAPRKSNMTLAEVEALAKAFLKVGEEHKDVEFQIDMIDERENENGNTIYSVSYSYTYGNGTTSTSFEIDKATGEIVHFYDLRREFTKSGNVASPISKEAALAKAIEYLKEWSPSKLSNYAKPINEVTYDKYSQQYQFAFPRVMNGIIVEGDDLMVSVGADGAIYSMYGNTQKIDSWPAVNKVIEAEKAKELYRETLKLQLQYEKQDTKDNQHYDLVYVSTFNGSLENRIDAVTGEWLVDMDKEKPVISHPTAADELNYLLNRNILEVKDVSKFNADANVTKGEALKILLNAVGYGYYGANDEQSKPTFSNVDKNHPLYKVVEQAVKMKLLSPAEQFAVDAPLTRQELAVWYIRVLNLENAAKHSDIYKLNFADASTVDPAYTGYVALAGALGLMDAPQNNFNATGSITYADLAVSILRLANSKYLENSDYRYY